MDYPAAQRAFVANLPEPDLARFAMNVLTVGSLFVGAGEVVGLVRGAWAYRAWRAEALAAEGISGLAARAETGTIEFQSEHAARHLTGTGLTSDAVEAAITQDIRASMKSNSDVWGPFWGRVAVNGSRIEYRGFPFNGKVNVGTYYPR